MKKIWIIFIGVVALVVAGCDLQPRITSLPDSVGDFISARYPALLADPDAQPEIYNSAATDYGVYASPELYGAYQSDDYVMYASVDDYIIPPENEVAPTTPDVVDAPITGDVITYHSPDSDIEMPAPAPDATPDADDFLTVPMYGGGVHSGVVTVVAGDTLYSIARKNNMTVDELARMNNLAAPYALRVGQKLNISQPAEHVVEKSGTSGTPTAVAPVPQPKPESAPKAAIVSAKPATVGTPTTTRVDLREITVGAGDTLYSISRKYSVPVNDLAVMNNLTAPFNLAAGQKLKVPNLAAAPVRTVTPTTTTATSGPVKNTPAVAVASTSKPAAVTTPTKATTSTVATAKPAVQKGATTPATSATQKAAAQKGAPTQTQSKPAQKISSDPKKKLPQISARSASKFSWPVRGKILSQYGAKSSGLFNDGINIGAARGTAVGAAENGVVAYAGNEVKGMGNLVIIQHADGWMTVYAHMDSMIVRRGNKVSVGQKIGTVGATGKVDKPQLHFEIRKGTKAYNPSSYLKK